MNYKDISNEICHLVEQINKWSSTIIIPQGNKFLNISSAAMGELSSPSDGATNQPTENPKGRCASVYQLEPQLFDENSWQKLKDMLRIVGCVSGCKLVTSHVDLIPTHQHLATYKLCCTHGLLCKNSGTSIF
jgi:hypothetical protein